MDNNEKIAVFAMGCFISNLVYTAWQCKQEKEQLKEIIRGYESIKDSNKSLLNIYRESHINEIKEYGDKAIDDFNRRADKALEDFDETLEELRKADFPTKMKELEKTLIELKEELVKLNE